MRQLFFSTDKLNGRCIPLSGEASRDLHRRGSSRLRYSIFLAVEHCHAHGVIHRDIKPGNIFVEDDGQVRLIDFGVAAERGARSSLAGYEEERVGTLPYAAPEQILDPATATYEAADIHSLGVVLYELLTGRIPWEMREDEDEEAYRARLPFEEPVPPSAYRPELPTEIEAVVLKAIHRNSARRHQSVAELRTELEAAFRAAASVDPATTASHAAGVARRWPALLTLAALLPLLAWILLSA
ncbi:MAG TPA: serine/threonine-protein kinase [Longimicrobium sp.]|nr:serine/threonine-protein kinase [Longimicrobium sp.]